jgi:hypothetical protein
MPYDVLCEKSRWYVEVDDDGSIKSPLWNASSGVPVFVRNLRDEVQVILQLYGGFATELDDSVLLGGLDLDEIMYDRCDGCNLLLQKEFYTWENGRPFCGKCCVKQRRISYVF